MIRQNNIHYYYDSIHDSLLVYWGQAKKVYYSGFSPGVYLIKEEDSDRLIGIEVLDLSSQNIAVLEKSIPTEIDLKKILSDLLRRNFSLI